MTPAPNKTHMKGGLFRKLLLAFWLACFVITLTLWLVVDAFGPALVAEGVVAQRTAPAILGAVGAALSRQGPEAAEAVRQSLAAGDPARVEILPEGAPSRRPTRSDGVVKRTVRAPDGTAYSLRYHYKKAGGMTSSVPVEPMVVALLCGPIFGALLAWYLVAPIQRLRSGFERLAAGDLAARLAPDMGNRHDEIADLARDFDVMAEQLQQLIRTRERLLHDVSHELRSPLSRLQLAIGLARQNPARLPVSLDRIEYEGRRLGAVVGELLSLARAESAHSLGEDYFDLAGVLISVLDDARFEAESTGVQITSVLDRRAASDDAPSLRGHAELVRWALDNVIRNALRYSTSGQTVDVRLAYDEAQRLYTVDVADEGPGAPEVALPTLFEPFARADITSPGYGLGLAIARRAVLTHGGVIEARNRAGAGLAIRIVLPAPRPA